MLALFASFTQVFVSRRRQRRVHEFPRKRWAREVENP